MEGGHGPETDKLATGPHLINAPLSGRRSERVRHVSSLPRAPRGSWIWICGLRQPHVLHLPVKVRMTFVLKID